MIIIRRAVAVVLGLVLVVGIIGAVVLRRVDQTAGDSAWLMERLRRGDVFTFAYAEAGPAAIRTAQEEMADPAIDFTKLDAELVGAVRALFPPDWLDQQLQMALAQVWPYLLGRTGGFAVEIPVQERFRAAGPGIKAALGTGRLPEVIYEDLVRDRIEEELSNKAIPFGLDVSVERFMGAARSIASAEWVHAQVDKTVDALLPYLAGDSPSFKLSITPSERREVAARELKGLVDIRSLREFLYREVLDPVVQQEIGANFRVPFQLVVTPADVQRILRETLPPEWADLQIEHVVDQAVAYAVGAKPGFSVEVPLAERQQASLASIGRLMDEKLSAAYTAAPVCTTQQLASVQVDRFSVGGIVCRPPGVSLTALKGLAGLADYQAAVGSLVDAALPDRFTFSQQELRRALGPQQSALLDDLRGWFTEGIVFTEVDLKEALARAEYEPHGGRQWGDLDAGARARFTAASSAVAGLEEFRERVRGGFHYNDQRWLDDLQEHGGEEAVANFAKMRHTLSNVATARAWGWAALAVLLLVIALLGGRSVRGKVLWGATCLVVAGTLLLVATPRVRGQVRAEIDQRWEQQIAQADASDLERTLLAKGRDVSVEAVGDAIGGLRAPALALVLAGSLAIAAAATWRRKGGARREESG